MLEFEVLDAAGLGGQVHDRVLGLLVEHQPRRVGLGIAADDHHLLPGLGQGRDQVLRGRGLADAALAVDRTLSQLGHDCCLLVCRWQSIHC